MKWKPLLFQMPISIILLTISANLLGFLSSTFFQSCYVFFGEILGEETLYAQIMYSLGAGMFIAYVAIPFSLVLIIVITLFFSRMTKWHLILSIIIGLFLGTSFLGPIYWGIPVLAYILTTSVSTCLLLMWRQKHLTR